MDNGKSKTRVEYLDVAKGIAMFSVIIGHYFGGEIKGAIGAVIWSFHMPIFIFLSGYFFKERGMVERIKCSFKSYVVPYILVWSFLSIAEAICCLLGLKSGDSVQVFNNRVISGVWALASASTVNKPDLVIKIGAIWFLVAMFWGSFFHEAIAKLKNRYVQFALVFLFLIGAVLVTKETCLPGGLNYGIAFLFWMWLGNTCARSGIVEQFIKAKWIVVASFLTWVVLVAIEYTTGNQYNICWLRFPLYGLELVCAFCGIVFVLFVSKFVDDHLDQIGGGIQYIGRSTIWILCVHAIDIEMCPGIIASTRVGNVCRCLVDVIFALCLKEAYKILKARPHRHAIEIEEER